MQSLLSKNKHVTEAALFLLLFSFFALIEGVARIASSSKLSTQDDNFDNTDGTQIPVIVFVMGGAAEALFGICGIIVAILQLFFDIGGPKATLGFAIMQSILGWFVFLVYVIAAPIEAAHNTEGIPDVLNQRETRALIILGNLMGSVSFCWALQGGQLLMAMRLLAAQKGQVMSKAKNTLSAMVWSGNQIMSAVSTLYVGILLFAKNFASTTAPIGAPPHVVWFPAISIVTGVVMLANGIVCIFSARNELLAMSVMPVMWLVTTMIMMVNFSWVFGIVPGGAPPIPAAAQHAGLILSVTILPVLHVWSSHFPLEDSFFDATVQIAPSLSKRSVWRAHFPLEEDFFRRSRSDCVFTVETSSPTTSTFPTDP